jgi:hypothetical protein
MGQRELQPPLPWPSSHLQLQASQHLALGLLLAALQPLLLGQPPLIQLINPRQAPLEVEAGLGVAALITSQGTAGWAGVPAGSVDGDWTGFVVVARKRE